MGKGIKNRVFGSTVPDWLKDKIEIRQKLSKSSEFGDSIDDSNKKEYNFDGLADLSSRTPFARMWTGLSIFEDMKSENDESITSKKELRDWYDKRNAILKQGGSEAAKEKRNYLKKEKGNWEVYTWNKISDDYQKIYIIH